MAERRWQGLDARSSSKIGRKKQLFTFIYGNLPVRPSVVPAKLRLPRLGYKIAVKVSKLDTNPKLTSPQLWVDARERPCSAGHESHVLVCSHHLAYVYKPLM